MVLPCVLKVKSSHHVVVLPFRVKLDILPFELAPRLNQTDVIFLLMDPSPTGNSF